MHEDPQFVSSARGLVFPTFFDRAERLAKQIPKKQWATGMGVAPYFNSNDSRCRGYRTCVFVPHSRREVKSMQVRDLVTKCVETVRESDTFPRSCHTMW